MSKFSAQHAQQFFLIRHRPFQKLQPHFSVRRVPHHGAKLETMLRVFLKRAEMYFDFRANWIRAVVGQDGQTFCVKIAQKTCNSSPGGANFTRQSTLVLACVRRSSISIPWRA